MKLLSAFLGLCLLSATSAQAQWQTLNASNSPLHSNVVREIAIDNSDGSKWIATQRALQKLQGSTWTTYTAANGPDYANIVCVAARNGTVWVGTDRGLSRFDGSTWTNFNDPTKLPVGLFGANDRTINDVVIAADGTVWMAGSRGLARFDGSTWTRFNRSNSGLQEEAVTALALDESTNTLWVGTNCNSSSSGVYALNVLNSSWRYYNMAGNACVHGIAVGATGTVFVGTCNRSGLMTLDNGQVSAFTPSSCVALDGVAPDPGNPQRVWVATESIGPGGTAPKGLLVYDGTAVVQQFNTANATLPSNLVSAVALERVGGRFTAWVGTADAGLAVYETGVSAQRPTLPAVKLSAAPNPAATEVTLQTDLSRYTLAVYDNLGRLLHTQEVNQSGPLRLAVGSWASGLYHVHLGSERGKGYARFSKS